MDVDTLVRRVKRQFGDEYEVIINNDDIYGWIYEAELDIIRNTGANELQMTQPSTSFPLSIPENVNIKRLSINGRYLDFLPPEKVSDNGFNQNALGAVHSYYRRNNTLILYPNDLALVDVLIDYTKIPVMMQGPTTTNTFTVPERYRTDVLQFCIAKAHNKNRNFQAERVHMENYERSLGIRREEATSIDGPIYKGIDPLDYEQIYF